jgi:hypothetical protein
MHVSVLLEKLLDVQRSVGTETDTVIQHKLMDVQDYVLAMGEERLTGYGPSANRFGLRELFSHIYSRS